MYPALRLRISYTNHEAGDAGVEPACEVLLESDGQIQSATIEITIFDSVILTAGTDMIERNHDEHYQ